MRIIAFCFMITTIIVSSTLIACASRNTFEKAKQTYQTGNYTHAIEDFQKLAELGDPKAQYVLGYMYYYGQGTAKDQDIARSWIRKAAKQGDQNALQAFQIMSQDAIQFGLGQSRLTDTEKTKSKKTSTK